MMTALTREEPFTITWRIENFSMCPLEMGEKLISPTFLIDLPMKTGWNISLFPRGEELANQLSCFLNRTDDGDHYVEVTIGYTLSLLSANNKIIISRDTDSHEFEEGEDFGFPDFSHRDLIFTDKDLFLPNDTLSIQCHIWRVSDAAKALESVTDPINLYGNIIDDVRCREILAAATYTGHMDFQKLFVQDQSSVRTIIKVERKSVQWPIKRFSYLQPNQRLSVPVHTVVKDKTSFLITCYLDNENKEKQCANIEIQRIEIEDVNEHLFVKCRIKTLGAPKSMQYRAEGTHMFKAGELDDVWKFETLIHINRLKKNGYLNFTDDVLFLYCELEFSSNKDIQNFEDTNFIHFPYQIESNRYNIQSEDNKSLYRNGKFYDISLRAGDKTFKAHKSILSARSPVFNAMFENDMKEKETGVVDIIDLDPDTVDRMLAFMYSYALTDLKQENAMNLYAAADKYEVLHLKHRCSSYLMSTLSLSTVCDVLTLAYVYQDDDLLDAAQNFIQVNGREIFRSQRWETVMESHLQLAADVMRCALTKSVD